MSQVQLANISGISVKTIQNYEQDRNGMAPTLPNLMMLADIFSVTPSYLYYGGRKRYSGDDYVTHLLNVSLLLVQMEAEESVIYAGMFCDVFRKTNVAIDELKENLPDSVVQILIRLKDYDIEKVGLEDEQCAVIKIAERLHNMRTIEYMEERERQKRAKETIAIFMPIVKKLQDDKLISELNEISINCLK